MSDSEDRILGLTAVHNGLYKPLQWHSPCVTSIRAREDVSKATNALSATMENHPSLHLENASLPTTPIASMT